MSLHKYLLLSIPSIVILTGCWGRGDAELTPTPTPPVITQQEIQTLKEELQATTGTKIVVPSGENVESYKEANLSPQGGIVGAGLAVYSKSTNETTLQLLADLPELSVNERYWVWLSDGTIYKRLGQANASKAGFLFDLSTSESMDQLSEIIVSKETSLSSQPTEIVLKGQLK